MEAAKLGVYGADVTVWAAAGLLVCGITAAAAGFAAVIPIAFLGAAASACGTIFRIIFDHNYRKQLDEKAILHYYKMVRLRTKNLSK